MLIPFCCIIALNMEVKSIGSIDRSSGPHNTGERLGKPPKNPSNTDANASQIADALGVSGEAFVFVTGVTGQGVKVLEDELTKKVGEQLGGKPPSTQRVIDTENNRTLIIFSLPPQTR